MKDRGGGRYEKMVVLLLMDLIKNVGGAKDCLLSKLPKVGGAIAPPVPPVPMALKDMREPGNHLISTFGLI